MENQIPKCPVCGKDMNFIKAGVSKTTGQPYNAFWGCPDKCKKPKVQQPTYQQQVYSTSPSPISYKKEETDWDKISWGKCKFGFLIELMKSGTNLKDAEFIAEDWADAAMRPKSAERELDIPVPSFN